MDRPVAQGSEPQRRTRLDASFAALSDATRRGILEQLGRQNASITELAEKFHMTLTGTKKHVGVLEQAGLVTTEKVGRVRTCKLGLLGLEEEAAWIERHVPLKIRTAGQVAFAQLPKLSTKVSPLGVSTVSCCRADWAVATENKEMMKAAIVILNRRMKHDRTEIKSRDS